MTENEAYKVHIQYTFNSFCKVVIRHAAIDIKLCLWMQSICRLESMPGVVFHVDIIYKNENIGSLNDIPYHTKSWRR